MFKKTILTLLATCCVAQTLSLPVAAQQVDLKYLSNLHTQVEPAQEPVQSLQPSLEGFEQIAENESLIVYVEPTSLALKIYNKKSDYLWSSTIDNKENEKLNNTWQKYVESAVTITYIDSKNRSSTESITTDESEVEFQKIENGFAAKVKFSESKITVGFEVKLEDDELVVHVPQNQVEDGLKNKIVSLDLYPFLGATKNAEIEGYMFLPDGSGALMRYEDGSKNRATAPYIGNIYGTDLGFAPTQGTTEIQPPEQIYAPVYGVVHGEKQQGLSALIESGTEYAQIQAYPAGLSTEYNFLFSRFAYRHQYFQPTSKDMTGVNVYQTDKNEFDATIRYDFYEGETASYTGFAKEYQKYLVDTAVLTEKTAAEVDMRIEFLGAERKKGLLFSSVIPLTTFEQAQEIIQDLYSEDIKNLDVAYRGYTKGGMSGTNPQHFPLERKVGTKAELQEFQTLLAENGTELGLYLDLVLADSEMKNYSGTKDVAKAANTATIATQKFDYTNLYLTPQKTKENSFAALDELVELGVTTAALPQIGTTAFTDSNKNESVTRTETIAIYQEILEAYQEQDVQTGLYRPTATNFEYADEIYDIPMNSSQYLYFTDTVPFLQIVLKGYVDYYAPFSNFSADLTDETLRMIEYGAFPAFYLTAEPTSLLKETGSQDVYSAEYELWREEIIRQYSMVQKALNGVQGETIDERIVIEPGVVKVVYSNNQQIYVNYTTQSKNVDGIEIPAKDFTVR
ncbi:MAG: DUF5696 domain-containing protein [Culicoidibacterales bacterium]